MRVICVQMTDPNVFCVNLTGAFSRDWQTAQWCLDRWLGDVSGSILPQDSDTSTRIPSTTGIIDFHCLPTN